MNDPRGGNPRPHRPALYADLTEMIDAAGGDASPNARSETAAATAVALVRAGRAVGELEDLLTLSDRIGLDTLAELWRDADPVSLPGSLWTLYVLRQWCRARGDEVSRFWRAGEPLAPADAVVAGLADYPDPDAARIFADAVLAGVYRGDLAVALERAAAFFRVVAAGRRAVQRAVPGAVSGAVQPDEDANAELAVRNERAAVALTAAASRWRAGTLP